MTEQPQHMFVERQTYRRRRLRDGARLLPVVGAVLVMIPLLWSEGADGLSMSNAIRYLFTVWAALVIVAFVLSLFLRDDHAGPGGSGSDAVGTEPEAANGADSEDGGGA